MIDHVARLLAQEGADDLEDEEIEGSLYAAVQNMSVMQKIKLARMGNKEARGLLVRDRNKIVAAAAVRSPTCASTSCSSAVMPVSLSATSTNLDSGSPLTSMGSF